MIVTIVYLHVIKENIDGFIRATETNQQNSVREAGNLRFDFIRKADDPTRFVLYEAYESEEAAARHKKTEHYLAWRETVAGWMASPREGVKYQIIRI